MYEITPVKGMRGRDAGLTKLGNSGDYMRRRVRCFQLNGPRSRDTPVATSTSRSWFLTSFSEKRNQSSWEKQDSRGDSRGGLSLARVVVPGIRQCKIHTQSEQQNK